MTSRVTVGYFLEDIAQERFITGLVLRVASELGLAVRNEVRNASGGKGRAIAELRAFLRDVSRSMTSTYDVLVVAIDGNCNTYQGRRREIEKAREHAGYGGCIVCAVPDPHIERWYLADAEGFRQAIAGSQPVPLPAYKCERARYKQALREAVRAAGIELQLGGAEFAQDIVETMNLYRAGQVDAAFKHFIDDLRAALGPLARKG